MTGKKIAVIIIILAAAAAAFLAYWFFGRGNSTAAGDPVYVQSVGMLTNSYASTERFSGIVETQKTEKVEFDSERKLNKMMVKEGDIVKEGDDLFSYDTDAIKLEIEQAQLEIDKLNMDIQSSTDEINALNANLDKIPAEDKPEQLASIKQLQADISQAQYDIKTKESEIKRNEATIKDSVVKAKMAGIVEKINDAQDIVDGKSYTEDGTPDNTIILIRAEGDYRIKGKADEQSILFLSKGMDVIVRSRIDDRTWKGKISVIDTQSTESGSEDEYSYSSGESASRYAFYVELDTTEGILLGQHMVIEPDYGQTEQKTGIWLNSGYICNEDGTQYIWAAENESSPLEKRPVETGETDSETDEVQITKGLSETDLIAWPDANLKEGSPVTTEVLLPEDDMEMNGADTVDYEEMGDFEDSVDYDESVDYAGPDMYDSDYGILESTN